MDPLTIALIFIALFMLFLMFTSGHRKHQLESALNKLETERMRLMKSIEHVKLSFYHKKINEKEAQDKIFDFEEKLRGLQERILDIKEKPLMRTVKKQEQEDREAMKDEAKEVKESERLMMTNFAAKSVLILFVIAVVVIMAVSTMLGTDFGGGGQQADEGFTIPISARVSPSESTYPGSSAGLRVEMTNTLDESLEDIRISARAPEGSGIDFGEGELGIKIIPELEKGGVREVYFPINVDLNADDGEYVMEIEATNDDDRLRAATTARLIVRIGAEENV